MLWKKLCLHGTINIALCAVRCLVLAVLVRNVYKVHDPNYYRNEATKTREMFVQFAPPLNIQHLM